MQSEVIHRGRKFDFVRLREPRPGGGEIVREVVRHPGAAVIVPLLAGGRVALIRNRRPAVGETLWELPAGTLEPGEAPEKTAARELEEETGYSAGRLTPLGRFYTTPGMTDELMHAFLATDLNASAQRLEDDEDIRVEVVPVERAMAMLDEGDLMDGKSMLALLLAQRRGLLGGAQAGGGPA